MGPDLTLNATLKPHLRFLVSGLGSEETNTGSIPSLFITKIPSNWLKISL